MLRKFYTKAILSLIFVFALNISALSQCPPTVANFVANPTIGCSTPHTVFFTDQSTLPDTWLWNFGDGSTSTLQNPIHNYTTTGSFTVTLTIADTIFGCTSFVTNVISVSTPVADFSASPTFGCGPLSTNFTDLSSSSAGVNSWDWDFGDGNTSTMQNPAHIYDTPGVYNVSLTITDANGCTDNLTQNSYIQVIGPDVDWQSNVQMGCDMLTVEFTDQTVFGAPIVQWAWDFGDGNSANLQNPSNTYSSVGEFDASLTVTDIDGCTRTFAQNDHILVDQSHNINTSAEICFGSDYTFPDGSTQTNLTTQTIQTSNLNTVSASCDSIIVTTVDILPTYSINQSDSVCFGGDYTFPDGTVITNITAEEIHTSNLSTLVGSCDSVIVTTVGVSEINIDVSQNENSLTSDDTDASYQWVNCPSSMAISGANSQTFVATQNGDYAVILTQNGCVDTSACHTVSGLGLNDTYANEILLYPNPATNQLFLNVVGIDFVITDLSGKTVMEGKTEDGKIGIENIEKGSYILQIINSKGEVATKPFVKG